LFEVVWLVTLSTTPNQLCAETQYQRVRNSAAASMTTAPTNAASRVARVTSSHKPQAAIAPHPEAAASKQQQASSSKQAAASKQQQASSSKQAASKGKQAAAA